MANQKGIVAKVNLIVREIEGIMLPNGEFGITLQQLRELAFPKITPQKAKRTFENVCNKDIIFKIPTELNNRPQCAIHIKDLEYCLTQFAIKGYQEAQNLLYELKGLGTFKKEKPKKEKQGYIYLFEGDNILKLGYSTNVKQRLRGLSRWKGELELVCFVKGTINKEKSLHNVLHNTGDYFGDEWYPTYRKHEILNLLDSKIEHKNNNIEIFNAIK